MSIVITPKSDISVHQLIRDKVQLKQTIDTLKKQIIQTKKTPMLGYIPFLSDAKNGYIRKLEDHVKYLKTDNSRLNSLISGNFESDIKHKYNRKMQLVHRMLAELLPEGVTPKTYMKNYLETHE